jgi:hypothetical protein
VLEKQFQAVIFSESTRKKHMVDDPGVLIFVELNAMSRKRWS